jgi:phage shock protein A
MTPGDFSDEYDPSEADPEVRELRAKIRELEIQIAGHTARIDQIQAAIAERAREMQGPRAEQAEVVAMFDDLECRLAEMKARLDPEQRLRAWLVPVVLSVAAG